MNRPDHPSRDTGQTLSPVDELHFPPEWDEIPDAIYDAGAGEIEGTSEPYPDEDGPSSVAEAAALLLLPEQNLSLPPERQAWREEWRDRFKDAELATWLAQRQEILQTFGPRPPGSLPSAPWPPAPFTQRHTWKTKERKNDGD